MKQRMQLNIKWRLVLAFTTSVLFATLLLGIISYKTAEKRMEEEILQNARKNVVFLDRLITKYIEDEKKSVELLAEQMNDQLSHQGTDARIQSQLSRFLGLYPELKNVYVVTSDGKMRIAPIQQIKPGYNPLESGWYREAIKAGGSIIMTEPYLDSGSKEMVITLARALEGGGDVVAVDMSLKDLAGQIAEVKIGNEGYAYLLDKNRHYIVHPTAKIGEQTNTEQSKKMYTEQSGEFDYEFEGKQKKMFFTTNKITGWKLAGTMYVDEPKAAARPILNVTIWVTVLAIVFASVQNFFVIRSLVRRLLVFTNVARSISEGDLTKRVQVTSRDELGALAVEFNKMSEKLHNIVQNVQEKSEQLAASSEQLTASAEQTEKASAQIASVIQEVANGAEKQAHSVETTSTTMDVMSEQIHGIADQAARVSTVAEHASARAYEGNEAIQSTVHQMNTIHGTVLHMESTMKNLEERSGEIDQIVQVITGIAEQTNLLALNAAIEAARAGENGRGFAVVADEVRKLAEQSAASAGRITELIYTIQQEIKQAVDTMEEGTKEVEEGIEAVRGAGHSFEEIQGFVYEVAQQIAEVSSAAHQVAAGAEQIAEAVHVIQQIAEMNRSGVQEGSAATEEQLASMEEITSSAATLSRMAEELQHAASTFKLK